MNISIEKAREYLAAGLSVLPAVKAKKRPGIGSWKTWSQRLPTDCEIGAWFANPVDAVCIVAGKVSGNLECIDFDSHGECFEGWAKKIEQELFDRLVIERTPSGGYHVFYRVEGEVGGNRKLAQGVRNGKKTTLVETRSEGGLFLCAPTEGYRLLQGSFSNLAVITEDARRCLTVAAEEMNEVTVEPAPVSATQGGNSAFLVKPGDDFAARGEIRPILERHGWKYLGVKQDGNELWQRPGKSGDGCSATFNGQIFCVFSTNAAPFEAKGYNKFQVYGLLEHNGDFTAAARTLLDLGYGAQEDPTKGVDISGILRQRVQTAHTIEEPQHREAHEKAMQFPDPGPMPDDLYNVPGFVADLMQYTLRTAYYPNRTLAFAGALAMMSHLTGRRYKDQRGSRFNLYLLALAKSGVGKEHPRTVNIDLATKMAFIGELGDTFASGEGLEDSLCLSPSMLYQVDEIDYLFNTVKLKDSRAEQISAMLLKLYSESKTTHIMRKKALQRGAPSAGSAIIQPHLTMFGTATPKFFYQSLTERTMENGLLARCLVLEAEGRGEPGEPHEEDFPESVLNTIRDIVRMGHESNLMSEFPHQLIIQETPEATKRIREIQGLVDAEYHKADRLDHEAATALWARAAEKVMKLAALHAISRDAMQPVLDTEALDWAWRFVEHATRRMLHMAEMYVVESDFDALTKKCVRILKGKNGLASHGQLLRNMHLNKDDFKRVIDTLVECGTIEKQFGERGGVSYRLVE